jgi:hypothetical protein
MEFSDLEKRIFIIFGLGILVVLLAIFGFVRLEYLREVQPLIEEEKKTVETPASSPPTEPPPPVVIEEEERLLSTYRDIVLGIEISYPSDWIRTDGPSHVFFGPAGTDEDDQVQIWAVPNSVLDQLVPDKEKACKRIGYPHGDNVFRCSGADYVYYEIKQNNQYYFVSLQGDTSDEKFEIFEEMYATLRIYEL